MARLIKAAAQPLASRRQLFIAFGASYFWLPDRSFEAPSRALALLYRASAWDRWRLMRLCPALLLRLSAAFVLASGRLLKQHSPTSSLEYALRPVSIDRPLPPRLRAALIAA